MKVLTLETVRSILRAVDYRPGWTITAHPMPFGAGSGVWILIDGEVPDALRYGETTRIGVRAVVPKFQWTTEFLNWLAWRLERVERHESREFFQVHGKPWNSPHKRPQPRVDWTVRRNRCEDWYLPGWHILKYSGEQIGDYDTWEEAYQHAWSLVAWLDSDKRDGMVNG